MKRLLMLLLLVTLTTTSLTAQGIGYSIGEKRDAYSVKIDNLHIVISELGKIVAINQKPEYNEFGSDGRVERLGDVKFTYYSDFNSYESGKIKTIGNLKFTYYSDFNSYEAGKVKSIGDKKITYYSNFNSYESGKVKSIGGVKFTYYSDFNNYESGKVKSIGAEKYSYYSTFDNRTGELKSGSTKFTQEGVTFRVPTYNPSTLLP